MRKIIDKWLSDNHISSDRIIAADAYRQWTIADIIENFCTHMPIKIKKKLTNDN